MKSHIVRLVFSTILYALCAMPVAAQFYSDVTFVGSVHTGGYHAISGISVAVTNGGYYTNAVATTNYYRLCGTNAAGRIPLSTNIVVAFTGSSSNNAVLLSWTRAPGINRHVVEKSHNAGATWTNWLTVAPGTTSWLDTGSNAWTASVFTNLYSAIPAGTYPWASTGDLAGHAATPAMSAHSGLGTAATNPATAFATSTQGAKADAAWQNSADATKWLWSSDGVQITLTNYTGPNAVVIPEMLDGLPVTILSDNLFSPGGAGSGITSVTGGRNIMTIGDAFTLCTNLESVCFPNATSVGDGPFGSFYGCWALKTVSMPSLKNAGGGAFGWCPALTSISLPSLTNLGNGAFHLCTGLTSVLFSANAPSVVGTPYSSIPANHVTNYVLNATATGWGTTLGGMPVVRLPVYGSASSMIDCPSGALPTNDARFLASTYLVSAPASNSAAGSAGQCALGITGGTNFLYLYDSNGGGAGTGRWVRTEGSVTW